MSVSRVLEAYRSGGLRRVRLKVIGRLERVGPIASLEQYHPVYEMALRLKGARPNPRYPSATRSPMNSVLQSRDEWRTARTHVIEIGLHPHLAPEKNWDALGALRGVLARTDTDASVLDAGGERYSPLVEWLYLYGYRSLSVLNLAFTRPFRRGPIQYQTGDITDTPYSDGAFDVITSLSVLEHGVDVEAFLDEAARLLESGGWLFLSTDYWDEPIDTGDELAYGRPWQIFSRNRMETMLESASDRGFAAPDLDLSTKDPTVHWRGRDYTFVLVGLQLEN